MEGENDDEESFVISRMNSRQLEKLLTGFLPVVKLKDAKYMIGTDVKTILIKSDQLLVRVGGGFITLSEHLTGICYMECIRIH